VLHLIAFVVIGLIIGAGVGWGRGAQPGSPFAALIGGLVGGLVGGEVFRHLTSGPIDKYGSLLISIVLAAGLAWLGRRLGAGG